MGAIANLRPDLWGAIIAAVPFVDVLNTMSDTTLPLTPPEWPEWGNPLEDAAAYDLHRQLQPLRQRRGPGLSADPGHRRPVRPARHLLGAGEVDRPSCANTRPAMRPILLKINMEAGHGGASGRFDFLKEIALDYAFAVWAIEKGWETRMIVRAGDARPTPRRWPPSTATTCCTASAPSRRTPPSPAEMDARRRAVPDRGLPYLVAEVDGRGAGLRLRRPVPAARRLSLHRRGQRLCRARTPRARASAARCSPR